MPLRCDARRAEPEWLAALNLPGGVGAEALEQHQFPLQDILRNSLYYPAAGFDGRPVQFLGGFIHSFIYVDYGVTPDQLETERQQNGFDGYRLVGRKSLTVHDLAPNGWQPVVPDQYRGDLDTFLQRHENGAVQAPFAFWYIFERDDARDETHGPRRFSLVYIAADGIATYQALYWQNAMPPEVLTIIRPGAGFGGNYTDFTYPDRFFAWTVLHGHRIAIPDYMACGDILRIPGQAFWHEAYPTHVERFPIPTEIGVWRRRGL